MAALGPHTILQRLPDLEIHVDASNELRIAARGETVHCGSHGLRVLDAFAWPTSVQAASERLKTRSAEHWIQVTSTIVGLFEAGILRDTASNGGIRPPSVRGFGAASVHVLMLNDRVRTSSFLTGIQEVVRPGDIVVDIGTGAGV
jgi:hypothetical protein